MDLSAPTSEYQQRDIDEANDALDAIDAMVKDMLDIASKVAAMPKITLPYTAWNHFIGAIEDAIDDLTAKTRSDLMAVGGWRKNPDSMVKRPSAFGEAILQCHKSSDPMEQIKALANLRRE